MSPSTSSKFSEAMTAATCILVVRDVRFRCQRYWISSGPCYFEYSNCYEYFEYMLESLHYGWALTTSYFL